MKTRVHSGTASAKVGHMEVTNDGRTRTWRQDGTKSATVELWIDLQSLLDHLGTRAVKNRSGKAVLASGDIEARVVGPIMRWPPSVNLAKP